MKTIVSGILFVLLLVSVFMGAFNVQSAKANTVSRGEPVQATGTDWWPMFRHDPSHTGTSTTTAPTTNNTQWTSTAGDWVSSSPAVVGGLVYVGSDDPYGGGYVSCLNAATGAQVWNYTTSQTVDSSPAVVGGLVYVGAQWGDNHVYCLNATTGRQVWNYTTGDAVESSPAVVGGFVFVGSLDGNVYCLNAANGALVWNYTTGGSVAWSSPAVVGGFVFVGSLDDNVYCLNAANGALVWNYTTHGEVYSSPAVVGRLVYVGSDNSRVYCLDAATGGLIWNYTTGNVVTSSPAIANGFVFVGSNDDNVYCLDAATGAQVWNYTTGSWVTSSPAVVGGFVFVGSVDGKVYCLDAATGAQVWNYQIGGYVESSPAVVNGVVYVGSMDGKVYAFGPSLSPQTYSVSFSESGLAQGTQWSVTFNGTTSGGSSNTNTFYGVKDGTYSFTIGNVSGTFPAPADESVTVASPSSGKITVNGANVNQAITFQYTVALWDPVNNSYSANNFGTLWSEGGNCYGVSSTAVLYFMHYTLGDSAYPYFPSQDPQATRTLSLNWFLQYYLNNVSLAVMFHQVYGQNYPRSSPSTINEAGQYSNLIGNLTVGQPVVLILGNATSGLWPHAVVAWGAGTIGNGNLAGKVAVYLYDSNFHLETQEAIIDPATGNFSYNVPGGGVYDRFLIINPTGMMPDSRRVGAFFKEVVSQPFWQHLAIPGYKLLVTNKPITIIDRNNRDLKDYFTAPGNSQTLVKGIPGSSGTEEANVQVYAIPNRVPISVKDPGSNQSTLLITRVENESGQLVGYAYLLNATSSQGPLNYTVTPSNSSLLVSTGANALNASIIFSYATPENHSVFTTSNVQIDATQTANFTVTSWQMLNKTSSPPVTLTISPSVPEFPSALILPLFMIATLLAAVVLRRKRSGAHSEIVLP